MRDDFDALWRDLARFVPTDMRGVGKDFRRNFQDFVTASLRQMNLVTREEYDTQTKLLRRLEQQVSELEQKMGGEQQVGDKADRNGGSSN